MSRNRNVPTKADKKAIARQNKGQLRGLLESIDTRAALERVLPKYLTVERVVGLVYLATNTTPKLLECTPASVIRAVMQAAQLGLEPGGALGHAYLIPYGDECQMIPGYRGLLFLAIESGAVRKGVARLIYDGDEFEWIQGTTEEIRHRSNLLANRSDDKVIGAYAVVWLPDGSTQFEVMNRDEIEKVRRSSRAANSGPWVDWFGEMAKKTVLKRLLKQIAMSSRSQRLADAIELDNRFEGGELGSAIPGMDSEESISAHVRDRTRERLDALKQRMGADETEEIEEAEWEDAEPEPAPRRAPSAVQAEIDDQDTLPF